MKALATASVVCSLSALPLASQSTATTTTPSAAGKQAATPAAPTVIREISGLVLDKKTTGKGTVTVSGTSAPCSSAFDAAITVAPHFDTRGSSTYVALIFLPGVRHEIKGEVCWPSIGQDYRIEAEMGGNSETRDGRFVMVGSLTAKGTLTFPAATDAGGQKPVKVFRVKSTGSKPLVLLVSTAGYRYVAGEGSLITPAGQTFRFPR